MVVLKLIKLSYISADFGRELEKEIEIQSSLDHPHICKILDYGFEGVIVKPSGRKLTKVVYIILEHIEGSGVLLDLVTVAQGKLKESISKHIMG